MSLLRSFEDRDYWPEYSTFLIRDCGPAPSARPRVSPLLNEFAVALQPCGSVARGGNGWLDGIATDAYHRVRLEAHDAQPDMDSDGWSDVVETPMVSGGVLNLTHVTGATAEDPFRIGAPGLYRARFARRPGDDGDAYRVQFWPVAAPVEPPRWFARTTDDLTLYLTSDMAMLLLWSLESGTPITIASLADRLLLPADTVRDLLRHTIDATVLEPFDIPDALDAAMRPTVRPREVPQPDGRLHPPTRGPIANVAAATIRVSRGAPGQRGTVITATGPGPTMSQGRPPRSGIVGNAGEIIVWRDGEPVEFARWVGPSAYRAIQSRHGIVLLASTQLAVLRDDGSFDPLGTSVSPLIAIDAAGDRLAVNDFGTGRQMSSSLRLIDLRDGSATTMPGDYSGVYLRVRAIVDGAVYVDLDQTTLRWRPGSDPEPLPWRLQHLDPHSGIAVATDGEPGSLIVLPGGQTWRIATDLKGGLAPGGTHIATWTFQPSTLTLTDIAHPDRIDTVPMPGGVSIGNALGRPIWEDRSHVLCTAVGQLFRVDVPNHAIESIALPPRVHPRCLIEPAIS